MLQIEKWLRNGAACVVARNGAFDEAGQLTALSVLVPALAPRGW